MENHLIKKITKTKFYTLCIMNYALCIILTACGNPDAGINIPDFFSDVDSVSAGDNHTMAIKTDGTLWAWGSNEYGKLGDGTTTDRYIPVQIGTENDWKAVSAGNSHTVAIKGEGELWAWGRNNSGQLGDGTTTNSTSPVQVMKSGSHFTGVKVVSVGGSHTVAIDENDNLWAWGGNSYGKLGDGSTVAKYNPVKVLTGVKAASAGEYHTVAIKGNGGELWAWGRNDYGQLGDGTKTDSSSPVKVMESGLHFTDVKAVSAGYYHTVAIKGDGGELWAWGSNLRGQLGDGASSHRPSPVKVLESGLHFTGVETVSAGGNHTVAIKDDGSLWSWGLNEFGQLGDNRKLGSVNPNPNPVKIGDGWIAVCAGQNYTLAIKTDRILWAWGNNESSQLGDNTRTSRTTPHRVIMSFH